jgi:hypothetical protein
MATYLAQQKLTSTAQTGLNFQLIGISSFSPRSAPVNDLNVERHKKTVLVAMAKHLRIPEIEQIISQFKRTLVDDDSILADFFNGDIPKHEIPKDRNYYRALQFTTDAFRPPTPCRPVHLLDIYDRYPFNLNVSAETPFVSDPKYSDLLPDKTVRKSFANMKHIVFSFTRRWMHYIKEDLIPPNTNNYMFPMLLHSKTALVDIDDPNKMRTIWGTPKLFVLTQIVFFWRYFAWIKSHRGSTPLLWGYETLTGGWLRLNSELFHNHMKYSFLMIDWKRFDKYAEFSALRDIFTNRRQYIDFDHGYEPTHNYRDTTPIRSNQGTRMRRLWGWMISSYFHMDIVLPDGRRFKRLHAGIPSGVYTTQLDDSQYNTLMLSTILYSLEVPFDNLKVLGDDSLARLLTCIPPNQHHDFLVQMQRKADHYFGSIVSLDKSKLKTGIQHCEVLSYENNHGLPYRDPLPAMANFYHTKARSPSPQYTMTAALGYSYALPYCPKRYYNVLKDIYDYYASKDFTPDVKHLAKLGFEHIMDLDSLPPSLPFPTRQEIRSPTNQFSYTSKQMEKFWPQDYFINEA